MNTELIHLIASSTWLVQLVLILLFLTSIVSWTIIVSKSLYLNQQLKADHQFSIDFRNADDLNAFNKTNRESLAKSGPLLRIFVVGMKEFNKLSMASSLDKSVQNARRAMRSKMQKELDALEHLLAWLASIGSVSPYIGLLGTTWGIMHAFLGFADLQQVTLAKVAPGIAEALIATAVGLFVAIPAVLAYNHLSSKIDHIANNLETFIEDMTNLLQSPSLSMRS
ncbi:MAG: protein TolQ [Gammaproteobacteria bacterium]|nr:protein TolQ [Gammaproteobacteria bacterium]